MARPNVYEIAPGRYAYGIQGEQALAVIQREMRPGRPRYFGVRGVRPTIDKTKGHKRVAPTGVMLASLTRIAEARFN